jgi:BirA family biotin operon repressor/biotin-[acetyl-CoA-carboxylase] ligase
MNLRYLYDVSKFKVYECDEIDSTNTYLQNMYSVYPNYFVLKTLKQTNGRGRYKRVWESDDDLIFSILFKEKKLNHIVAPLAICMALEKYDLNVGIKWPNDIYLDSKKLCGILIEDIYETSLKASIVGIGLNIAKKNDDYQYLAKYITIDKDFLLKSILEKYNELLNMNLIELIQNYKKYSIIIGKAISYKNNLYIAKDITTDGHLVISNEDNTLEISSDEIDIKSSLIEKL